MIMNNSQIWFLILAGLGFMLLELMVPGLVFVFLGIAALLVAALMGLGLIEGWFYLSLTWVVVSLVLLGGFRKFFARIAPGNTLVQNMDEDIDAIGITVIVEREVSPEDELGRISFRGSTWAARSLGSKLAAGSKAILVKREGNVWFIKEQQ